MPFHFAKPIVWKVLNAALATVLTMTAAAISPAFADTEATTAELENFKRAVRAKYDLKERAFANNDPEPILTRFYTANVISTDPGGHTHIGRDQLRPIYQEVIVNDVRIEPFKSFVNGNAGWDWVNFHVIPAAKTEAKPFSFKMIFLWERINGEWWSHGEMYVTGEF